MLALNFAPLFTFGEVLRRLAAIIRSIGRSSRGAASVYSVSGCWPGSPTAWSGCGRRIEMAVDDGDDSVTTLRERRGQTISSCSGAWPGGHLRRRPAPHLQRLHQHRPDPRRRRHPRPGRVVRRAEPGQGRHLRLLHPVREPVRHRRRDRGGRQEWGGREDDPARRGAAGRRGDHAHGPEQRDQGCEQQDPRLVPRRGGRRRPLRRERGPALEVLRDEAAQFSTDKSWGSSSTAPSRCWASSP